MLNITCLQIHARNISRESEKIDIFFISSPVLNPPLYNAVNVSMKWNYNMFKA